MRENRLMFVAETDSRTGANIPAWLTAVYRLPSKPLTDCCKVAYENIKHAHTFSSLSICVMCTISICFSCCHQIVAMKFHRDYSSILEYGIL